MTSHYDFTTEAWEGHYDNNLQEALKRCFPHVTRESKNGADRYSAKFAGGQARVYHVAHPQSNSMVLLFAGLQEAVRGEFEKLRLTLRVPLMFGNDKSQEHAEKFGKKVLDDYFKAANDPLHQIPTFEPISASRD